MAVNKGKEGQSTKKASRSDIKTTSGRQEEEESEDIGIQNLGPPVFSFLAFSSYLRGA